MPVGHYLYLWIIWTSTRFFYTMLSSPGRHTAPDSVRITREHTPGTLTAPLLCSLMCSSGQTSLPPEEPVFSQ